MSYQLNHQRGWKPRLAIQVVHYVYVTQDNLHTKGWVNFPGWWYSQHMSHIHCWEELTLTMTSLGKDSWKLCVWNSPGFCPLHLFPWLTLYPFIVINYSKLLWVLLVNYQTWKWSWRSPNLQFKKWGWFCDLFSNFTPSRRGDKGSCWLLGAVGNWALQRVGVDEAIYSTGVRHWRSSLPRAAEAGIWGSCSCCRSQVLEKPSALRKLDIYYRSLISTLNQKAKPLFPAMSLQCPLLTKFSIMPASKRKYSNLFLHSR